MRRVFSLPYDSGHQGLRMGAGPLRLRELFDDVEEIDAPGEWRAEIRTSFEVYGLLASRVRDAVRNGAMPIVLSGNCGACAGTVAGLGSKGLGVVWLDTHGDLMTPDTTTSGRIDSALSIRFTVESIRRYVSSELRGRNGSKLWAESDFGFYPLGFESR